MLAQINKNEKEVVKKHVNSKTASYSEVLDKMINDDWLNIDSRQQTISRLKRKGNRSLADQFAHFDDTAVVAKSIEATSPSGVPSPSAATAAPPDSIERAKLNKETKEAINGKDNMISSRFLHEGSERANTVCRISTYPDRTAKGTGFMISSRLMMTNHHVLSSAEAAKGYILEFDYYAGKEGEKIITTEFFLAPDELFIKSDENKFDYAVVAVEDVNKDGKSIKDFGWNKLIEEKGKASKGEPLNIIHHPNGDPQKISIRQNYLVRLDDDIRLDYMADTMEGSSGAPVYNEEWEVVALHRASEVLDDKKVVVKFLQMIHNIDEDLAKQMKKKTVKVNLGIRISVIVNSLRLQMDGLNLEQQSLLQEVFDIPEWEGLPRIETSVTKTGLERTSNKGKEKMAGHIHRQINISGGSVNFNSYKNSDNEYPKNSHFRRDVKGALLTPELYDKKINSQKSVFKALAFLQKARELKYLPEDQEIIDRKNAYYGSIIGDINTLTPKKAYNELHDQISTTLSIVSSYPDLLQLENAFGSVSLEGAGASYDRARAHLYTWIDLHPDRVLRGVYTDAIIAPEQLLLKDLITKLDFKDELPQRFKNNQYLNCEHIVPQSWFKKESTGVADLHHLITADGANNNFRSDSWYDDLGEQGQDGPNNLPPYILSGGWRSDDKEHFEPRRNKALVARASLYFIVAHKGKLTVKKYSDDQIKTLIKWSKSAAPSKYELHRNEAIFEVQGNRNPFIDFPDWVDAVDFSEGMV